MKIKQLLGNRFLARRVKRPTQTNSTIILPPILQDDDNTGGPKEWEVLAVGPGKQNRNGILIPIEFGPGDRVICHSYTTGAVEAGDGCSVLTDDMVIAVVPVQR